MGGPETIILYIWGDHTLPIPYKVWGDHKHPIRHENT